MDPNSYEWHDRSWQTRGITLEGQVIYEVHIGAFSQEGNYGAVAKHLPELRELGITLIQIMPLAEFPGRWNWGYDGVDLYAPAQVYGTPDELKFLIDYAHSIGLGVILDAVYNHLGCNGNYLSLFSSDYFTDRYKNEWGEAINFDGPDSKPVREFFIQNACYW